MNITYLDILNSYLDWIIHDLAMGLRLENALPLDDEAWSTLVRLSQLPHTQS